MELISATPVQFLASLEFLQVQPVLFRIAQFTQKTRKWFQVVDIQVIGNVYRVGAQQFPGKRDLHDMLLDIIQDGLIQVTGADPVVTGIMEPVVAAQLSCQGGLGRPRTYPAALRIYAPNA